jgi:2-amino-4-hydroxy-6-hydroxymethyldihydropteridine diphosphokinase
MSKLFIGVGSNKGDRNEYIKRALEHLEKDEEIKILKKSSIIETEPAGNPEQDKFLNMVIELETFLDPYTLFRRLKNIERYLGRQEPHEKWSPREIDLDILLFDDLIIKGKNLIIPHTLMHERDFVLRPLCEIAPDVVHPGLNKTAKEMLEDIDKPHDSKQDTQDNSSEAQPEESSE